MQDDTGDMNEFIFIVNNNCRLSMRRYNEFFLMYINTLKEKLRQVEQLEDVLNFDFLFKLDSLF